MIDREKLQEATLELAVESGAVIDMIKKVLYHGHELDDEALQAQLARCGGALAHIITATCNERRAPVEEAIAVGDEPDDAGVEEAIP